MRTVGLVLFGDLLRTVIQETASHIALRNCSEEVGRRELSVYMILVKGVEAVKHIS